MDRQKKILIIAGAWVSAALLTWFLYAKTVAPQQEKHVRVVVASHDMPLGTLLRQTDIKMVNYPERDVPKGVVFDPKNATNRVLLFPMSVNEPLLMSKVSSTTSLEGVPSTIEPGYRAVSVPITDSSGVAGLIQANARVDVLFTRAGNLAEASTSIILQNVKVLSTGKLLPAGQTLDPRTPRAQVVTLLLRPNEAQKLELAKNQGKIGLSLRNPLDGAEAANAGPITTEALDPTVNDRIAASKRSRARGPNLDDPKTWQDLVSKQAPKKEPEKPRVVVDVFRGDKHVQETFR